MVEINLRNFAGLSADRPLTTLMVYLPPTAWTVVAPDPLFGLTI